MAKAKVFDAQELAGLIRGQLHERTFDLYSVKFTSVQIGLKPATLEVTVRYESEDGSAPAKIQRFVVRIEAV